VLGKLHKNETREEGKEHSCGCKPYCTEKAEWWGLNLTICQHKSCSNFSTKYSKMSQYRDAWNSTKHKQCCFYGPEFLQGAFVKKSEVFVVQTQNVQIFNDVVLRDIK
jgi:hypothetical protein